MFYRKGDLKIVEECTSSFLFYLLQSPALQKYSLHDLHDKEVIRWIFGFIVELQMLLQSRIYESNWHGNLQRHKSCWKKFSMSIILKVVHYFSPFANYIVICACQTHNLDQNHWHIVSSLLNQQRFLSFNKFIVRFMRWKLKTRNQQKW